jgi:predicted Zn-dependent peptidase
VKVINLQGSGEKIYYEKLNNGLEVYMYTKENYHNNYVTFTTKFGSIYNEFVPIGKENFVKVPNGVAHFLEHKVFVQEKDPQPDEFFANNGATCNAYTTFKNTTYLFSGSSSLKENLSFLLDYVQSPYFTEENVNSEKGIITQEINMCNDEPSDVLYENIRKNSLKNNPFKESIIGTVEDINSITPELLNTCYNTFYHPSNMFLVVTGNFNPEEILKVIKDNQNSKSFADLKEIKIKKYEEPDTVSKESDVINVNTDISKVAYNLKINSSKLEIGKRKLNLYLYIIFTILFDDASKFTESEKEKGIITNSISVNLLNCDSHILISLINQTDNYDELLEDIKECLKNITIKEEDFNRKKKVLISNELFSFENIEVVNEMIIDNIIFDGEFNSDNVEVIKSLSYGELKELLNKLDLSNNSTVILKKITTKKA